jgi:phosphoribosylformylglycinamidine (FGAM) synthase-like enzyme
MYVGSKTGRDGIHSATAASDLSEESSAARQSRWRPPKLLLEACLS